MLPSSNNRCATRTLPKEFIVIPVPPLCDPRPEQVHLRSNVG